MTGHRDNVSLIAAFAVLAAGSILLYRVMAIASVVPSVGSGAVAIVVLAHVGVLAAVVAPLMASRRRWRGRKE